MGDSLDPNVDKERFMAYHKSFCDTRRKHDLSTVCYQAWQPFLSCGASDIEMHVNLILIIDDYLHSDSLNYFLDKHREATKTQEESS